jgi:hypothetical protein
VLPQPRSGDIVLAQRVSAGDPCDKRLSRVAAASKREKIGDAAALRLD